MHSYPIGLDICNWPLRLCRRRPISEKELMHRFQIQRCFSRDWCDEEPFFGRRGSYVALDSHNSNQLCFLTARSEILIYLCERAKSLYWYHFFVRSVNGSESSLCVKLYSFIHSGLGYCILTSEAEKHKGWFLHPAVWEGVLLMSLGLINKLVGSVPFLWI